MLAGAGSTAPGRDARGYKRGERRDKINSLMAKKAQPPLELLVYIRQEQQAFPLPPSGEVFVGRASQNDIRIDTKQCA